MMEVQNIEVESQPGGPPGQEGPPATGAGLEHPAIVPTPNDGETLFCFASLGIGMLTDHEQVRSSARMVTSVKTPSAAW